MKKLILLLLVVLASSCQERPQQANPYIEMQKYFNENNIDPNVQALFWGIVLTSTPSPEPTRAIQTKTIPPQFNHQLDQIQTKLRHMEFKAGFYRMTHDGLP